MGNFGDRLRREREMRGITLEEISHSTKIGTRHLRALENEEFNQLPGGVFNRGFVRAYAHFLGLDEDQCVIDYNTAVAERQGPQPTAEQETAERNHQSGSQGITERLKGLKILHPDYRLTPLFLLIGIILVLTLGGWYGFRAYKKWHASEPDHVDAATSAVPSAVDPTSTSNLANTATAQPTLSAVGQGAINVAIHLNQACWVSVETDGKAVMANMLQPQTDYFFSAQRTMKMVLGNAPGIEVSYNGKPYKLKEKLRASRGKAATLLMTPEGVQVVHP